MAEKRDIQKEKKELTDWLFEEMIKDLEVEVKKTLALYGNTPIDIEELKKKNENSETCVRCGKATKVLVQTTRYCPDCEFAMAGEEKYSDKKKRLEKEKKERELKEFDDKDAITKKTKIDEIDIDIDSAISKAVDPKITLAVGDNVQIMTKNKGLLEGRHYDGIIVFEEHLNLHGRQAIIKEIRQPQGQAIKGYLVLDIHTSLAFHPEWVVLV